MQFILTDHHPLSSLARTKETLKCQFKTTNIVMHRDFWTLKPFLSFFLTFKNKIHQEHISNANRLQGSSCLSFIEEQNNISLCVIGTIRDAFSTK